MHMQKKFQIFVSSTFVDLEDERRAVIEAILDLGHIPIGMEAFQAGNEEQWGYIKKRIDESDYYVVLVAERYGSEKDGVSYTEMEYDYARSQGVPVAAFLLAEDVRAQWKRDKAEFIDNPAKVTAFRKKCEGLMVRYWKNKDELAAACVTSLTKMFVNAPRDGWVPAKQAANPDVANELARLSEENKELREKLNILNGQYIEVDKAIQHLDSCGGQATSGMLSYCDILVGIHEDFIMKLYYANLVSQLNPIPIVRKNNEFYDKIKDFGDFIRQLLLYSIINDLSENVQGSNGKIDRRSFYVLTDFGKRVVRRIIQMREEQGDPA
jgi:hypothetical protein